MICEIKTGDVFGWDTLIIERVKFEVEPGGEMVKLLEYTYRLGTEVITRKARKIVKDVEAEVASGRDE